MAEPGSSHSNPPSRAERLVRAEPSSTGPLGDNDALRAEDPIVRREKPIRASTGCARPQPAQRNIANYMPPLRTEAPSVFVPCFCSIKEQQSLPGVAPAPAADEQRQRAADVDGLLHPSRGSHLAGRHRAAAPGQMEPRGEAGVARLLRRHRTRLVGVGAWTNAIMRTVAAGTVRWASDTRPGRQGRGCCLRGKRYSVRVRMAHIRAGCGSDLGWLPLRDGAAGYVLCR